MKFLRVLFLVTFASLLSACGASAIKVNADYHADVHFDEYETFSFISDHPLVTTDRANVSPLFEERLMKATRQAIVKAGYRFVEDRDAADVVVAFTFGSREKIRVNNYPAPYHDAYFRGWGEPYFGSVEVRNYTEGTLAIDLFDVTDRRPVWHGWAVKSILEKDRESPEEVLKQVIESILLQYPPKLIAQGA